MPAGVEWLGSIMFTGEHALKATGAKALMVRERAKQDRAPVIAMESPSFNIGLPVEEHANILATPGLECRRKHDGMAG